jgi:tRNA(Arg) A34 adenosine deaminase TadA
MKSSEIITNADKICAKKLQFAKKIISGLHKELPDFIEHGHGPFLAAIYRGNKLVAKCANTVVIDNCSNHHAEINVIYEAQKTLKKYDLSKSDISLYITAEPCMMCVGAIMWSGIKSVYYGVPSKTVEKLTGFDEGFKPRWFAEFKKRGITVYGNICVDDGVNVLKQYVKDKKKIYMPKR